MTAPPDSPASADRRKLTGEQAEALGLIKMGGRPPLLRYVAELWERREFIWLIPRSELRSRSMNTVLGSAWHLLNPLLLAAVYYIVFGVILPGDRGAIHDNYAAFLIIGIMTYYFTQKTIIGGARTVVNDVKLLQNVNFPAAVLPVSAGISEALSHVYAMAAMIGVVMMTGEQPHFTWLLVVPVLVVQLVMNWGLAFVTARLTVHFRDTEQFLPYLMRIGLYLSGVLFTADRIGNSTYRFIFELNPIYAFITLVRGLILDGTIAWRFANLSLAWAILIFVLGFLFFWQNEGEYSNAA